MDISQGIKGSAPEVKRKAGGRNPYRKSRQVKWEDNKLKLEFERKVKENKDKMIEETLLGRDTLTDLQACSIIMFMHQSDLLKIIVKKGLKELKRNHYSLT